MASDAPPLIEPAGQPLRRLFSYLAPHRRSFWLAISYSFFNKLLDLAPPVLVGWAVDTVAGEMPAFLRAVSGDGAVGAAVALGLLGILIFAFESFFEWLYTLRFMQLAQRVQHDLRLAGYGKMQQREMAFFENHRLGETMSMLNDDINQLERFLNRVFNNIVQIVALFIIAGFILFSASPALALIAIAPIPIVVGFSLTYQKLLAPRYRRVRETVGALNTRLENNLGGIAVIKAFGAESFEAERLAQSSEAYRDANFAAIRLAALFTPLIRMGVALGFGATLAVGTIWTLEGSISVGTFTLFAMMCQRILWPLTGLGAILDETERCRASAARIFGLIDTPPRIVDRQGAMHLQGVSGRLAFHDVRFNYGKGHDVLRGLSFSVAPGETIGLAGATGAGKSTLVKLLLRFYDPNSGKILLDDKPLTDLTMASIRQHVALVSQDVYLFHGTIAENIAYGSDQSEAAKIEAAARQAQLHDFIETLPDGYGTIIGERGIKLSGGQRQRLSIARALMKDAPIIVLDEATSSVDTETERSIQLGLRDFTRGRTALIIAHRLSTIRHADRILVLSEGRVVEQGTHEELVASGGIYHDLWSVQSGELEVPSFSH